MLGHPQKFYSSKNSSCTVCYLFRAVLKFIKTKAKASVCLFLHWDKTMHAFALNESKEMHVYGLYGVGEEVASR